MSTDTSMSAFLERINHILQVIDQTNEATERSKAEFDRSMAESRAESERRKAEWEEEFRKSRAEFDNRMAKWAEEDRVYKAEKEAEEKKYKAEQKARDLKWEQEQKKWEQHQKSIARRMGHLEDRYGQFVESFVRNQMVRLLNERDIQVSHCFPNVLRSGPNGLKHEFDAVVVNGDTIVVVEVKSTLTQQDVEYFLKKMWTVRTLFPEYHDKKILGAMAFIHCAGTSNERAQKVGFFTILATASSASITNPEGFTAKEF